MTSSAAKEELAAVIDGILGDQVSIPVKQLPDRLIKYMQQYGYDVITPEECEEVREFITDNNFDMELNRDDVVLFMISMRDRPKNGSAGSGDESRHSQTNNKAGSESSSSSDDDRQHGASGASEARRPRAKTAFPGDPFMMPATLTSSTDTKPETRRKKISDSSSEKFSARGDLGVSSTFSRPSVGQSRRRSSTRPVSMFSDDGDSSRQGSGTWSSSSNPQSPLTSAVDNQSFHEILRSPTDRELDQVDESVLLEVPQAIIMEKDREISELRRQHAQDSAQAQTTIAVMEDEVAEMQRKLDEAFDQFGTDKKDMRLLYDRQIQDERARMEAELEELRRQLEAAKEELARGTQTWGVQQLKLKELTASVLEKERFIKELQEKLEHEMELKEEALAAADRREAYSKELARDLEVSRHAEHQLKLQKLENQHLQLTIENVNREYEQLQIQMEPGAPHGGHSGPVTLTRNSGVAIGKELRAANGEDEPIRERLIETVVTRTIKLSSPSSKGETKTETIKSQAVYTDASTETDPVRVLPVKDDEDSTAAASSSKQPDPNPNPNHNHLEEALKSPPAYTPPLHPEDVGAVLEAAHPRHAPCSSSLEEEDYDLLCDALGVRCRVMEDEMEVRRTALDRAGQRRLRRPRSGSLPNFASDRYAWITYSSAAFIFGALIGGHFFVQSRVHSGINPRDYAHFVSMNTLRPLGGEGFPVSGNAVWNFFGRTARIAATGFVPT